MLLSRAEMSYDFAGARLDPVRDKRFLGWAMNQFLYGEVTGIQVGHWLYAAPDIEAAKFFARQAVEEMQHVDNFLAILRLLDEPAKKPHAALRFLATGMMGGSFEEHVLVEMAMGEGQVLMALYGLIDILDHAEIVAILKRAVKQEERHVAFGEERTMRALERDPRLREKLLGLSLVSMLAVAQLARAMSRFLPATHPVLQRVPGFLRATSKANELRLLRIGVLQKPLEEMSAFSKARAIARAYAWKALPRPRARRLSDVYLSDPHVRAFALPNAGDGAAKAKRRGGKLSVV